MTMYQNNAYVIPGTSLIHRRMNHSLIKWVDFILQLILFTPLLRCEPVSKFTIWRPEKSSRNIKGYFNFYNIARLMNYPVDCQLLRIDFNYCCDCFSFNKRLI